MAIGPGKYDDLCTYVREKSGAVGAIVIIIEGNKGMGFSVQAPPDALPKIADTLREIAKTCDADLRRDAMETMGNV